MICVLLAGAALLAGLTGCTSPAYEETRAGNYIYLNPFAYKPATPQEHWDYAARLEEDGEIRRARRQFDILVKRWPESTQAASAKRAVADLYFAAGKERKAFDAYQELIDQYYTGIQAYDEVIERQFEIAMNEMNRKRMRWMFGGYASPERAIPLFEAVLRNAPQSSRSAEAQYRIGEAYLRNGERELAIVAFSAVEYRYPDSPFAEQAAVAKLDAFKKLVRAVPYSAEIREQAQLAVQLFEALYPQSEHLEEARDFGAELDEQSARHAYETGRFYERVPRPPAVDAAKIYYEKVLAQFGGTDWASPAAARMRVLNPPAEEPRPTEDIFRELQDAAPPPAPAADSAASGGDEKKKTDFLTGAAAAAASPAAAHLPSADEPAVEVTADRIEYADKLLIGEGSVVFRQQDTSLQAERVTVNPDTGEITASGGIVLTRGKNYWEGEQLAYNFKTREGNLGPSVMFFEPAYITADEIERVSTNEFRMRNVTITTCSGENPAVHARAREARLIDRSFIVAKHITFYAGPVPVFYLPHWQRHLSHRIFTTYVGYGSRVGAFFKTRANLRLDGGLTANSYLDLYSRRGAGIGQDLAWTTPGGGGSIGAWYINDNDPYDNEDTGPRRALIDDDRWRVRLSHRERFSDETYLQARFSYLSDPDILEDFFNNEFRGEANPENYAVLQHSADAYAAGVRADVRLNDFYDTVERRPDFNFDWYRARVPGTPLHFESRNSLALLQQSLSVTNPPPANEYDSARFDTYNRLFLPLRAFDFLNVIPRAGWRGTWYSDTVTGGADFRPAHELGALAAFKAYKPLTDKSAFFGTGLRHMAEPYADYSYRDRPDPEAGDLYFFDETDALGEQNEVRFGLRNFLQTKRGGKRIVNFLDADVYAICRLDPQAGQRDFSNIVAQTELSLTDSFSIETDLAYDSYERNVSPLSTRLNWTASDSSALSLEYRYLDGGYSQIAPSLSLFPNGRWSFDLTGRYDAKDDKWLEQRVLVGHRFDCIGAGVGYRRDEDNEHQIWLQLWLTAFPRAALDLGR